MIPRLLLPLPAFIAPLVVSLAFLASANVAGAQDKQERERNEDKAGFTDNPRATEHHLTFNSSIGGGYDQNVLVDTIGVADPRYQESGAYFGGGLGLSYAGRANRVEGTFGTGTSLRFYRAAEQFVASSYNVAGTMSASLSRRVKFNASGLSTFSPYYQVKVTDDPVLRRVYFDYGLAPRRLRNHQASAGLNFQTGKWSTLDLDAALAQTDFSGREFDMQATTVGAHFLHRVSRHASLRLGYSEQQGTFGTGSEARPTVTRIHNVDAGLDFARALTINPRTIFDFSFGSLAMNDGDRTRIEPTGHASLSHRVSDRWALKLEYLRNMSFVGGYRDAFLSDSASFGALGRLGRISTLQLQTGAVVGTVGATNARIDTYSAGARFRTRLGKNMSAYAESFYYRYRFEGGLAPLGYANMNRGTASVGIETNIPLLKERKPGATW